MMTLVIWCCAFRVFSVQVRGAIYDKGVDFWMLGILIYELLHGSTPFATESEINTYVRVVVVSGILLLYPFLAGKRLCESTI